MSGDDESQNAVSVVEQLYEGATALATGLPPQLQRSLLKTISHIFSSAGKWPSAFFEGKSKISAAQANVQVARLEAEILEIKSKQKSRDLIEKESAKIASKLLVNPDLAGRALDYHASHITSKQERYEDIFRIAIDDIKSNPSTEDSNNIIEDDILESILREGSRRSSEDFKVLFGKILAGEIRNPGTFSIGTIQSLGRLTKETASYFQTFCNFTISGVVSPKIVTDPFGSAGENSLSEFGLTYLVLICLVEEGLLRQDFNEWQEVHHEFLDRRVVFRIAGNKFFMSKDNDTSAKPVPDKLRFTGPALTKAGQELWTIVSGNVSVDYVSKFSTWLKSNGIILYRVDKEEADVAYGTPVV